MSINVTKLVAVETAAFTSVSTRVPGSLNIQTERKRIRNELEKEKNGTVVLYVVHLKGRVLW